MMTFVYCALVCAAAGLRGLARKQEEFRTLGGKLKKRGIITGGTEQVVAEGAAKTTISNIVCMKINK